MSTVFDKVKASTIRPGLYYVGSDKYTPLRVNHQSMADNIMICYLYDLLSIFDLENNNIKL